MERKTPQQTPWSDLLGQRVLIVYYDRDRPCTIRGPLLSLDENFLRVQGDYREKIIALRNVAEVTLEPKRGG